MKVEFSKAFIKSASKFTGKMKSSLKNVILEVSKIMSLYSNILFQEEKLTIRSIRKS